MAPKGFLDGKSVELSDVCVVWNAQGDNGEGKDKGNYRMYGITTVAHDFKLVKAGDASAKIRPGQTFQNLPRYFRDDNDDKILDSQSLPPKWGKIWGMETVHDVAYFLNSAENILIVAGAGISTSIGIPDFRSKNGLYTLLGPKAADLGIDDPQELFDLEIFKEDPSIFYSVAEKLLVKTSKVSATHSFFSLLQKHNKLLRVYSQNIDELEIRAGLEREKLVQVHGSMSTSVCMKCGSKESTALFEPEIRARVIPYCRICTAIEEVRARARATMHPTRVQPRREGRSVLSATVDRGGTGVGVMKPSIVFFGEPLPKAYNTTLKQDLPKTDLVLVIGSSMKVEPISEILEEIPSHVLKILINRTESKDPNFDIQLLGDCDIVVAELVKRCGGLLPHEDCFTLRARVEIRSGPKQGQITFTRKPETELPEEVNELHKQEDKSRSERTDCSSEEWTPSS